ncbi:MAG: TolC family protein [Gammaproteobacteria bacterium]|jgi:outer membrane protein TolC
MFFRKGLQPSTAHAGALRAPERLARAICATASLAAASAALAQRDVTLTLAEAERIALEDEPGQAAYLARAEALEEQSVAAEQLPDPRLRVGLANYPIESGGFSTEAMTQAQIGIQQSFPPANSRAHGAQRFTSLAQEMTETADARSRDVLAGVRTAWLESWYWERAAAIVLESRPFFAELAEITRSLYSVGTRDQQDVLRSELELSRLDDRLIEINRQRARARASLAQWLPDQAERPISESLPAWNAIPPLEEMRARLDSHPAIRAADARIDAREAGIELARDRYKSGWMLDVAYGYRDGIQPSGVPRSDMLSVGFVIDLPFFRNNRQDRALAAAFSERRAASETREQLRRRLVSELEAEHAHWRDLTRRLELYDRQILVQTSDHAQAALLAYQSEAGDFADVMRAYIDELNTRLDYLRLQVERTQSYAVLANLGGLEQ